MVRYVLCLGALALPAVVLAADVDGDLSETPADCNDADPSIHPGAAEVCEGSNPLAQVDNDCDDSVNTEDGLYFRDGDQLGSSARAFYFDADEDAYGEQGQEPYFLCARSADPQASHFVVNDDDCDDADASVNPDAVERCNGRDDNCSETVDEPNLGAEPPLGSVPYYVDDDRDGYATSEGDVLWVCPAFAADPDNKPPTCNPGIAFAVNIAFGGACWGYDNTDCADFDASVHPPDPGPGPSDAVDGIDSDCDGRLGLLDLDCDGDGAFPAPVGTDPANVLGSCVASLTTPEVACFGRLVPLSCEVETGQWVVDVEWLNAIGVMSGAYRTSLGTGGCDGVDCDDLCPHRCGGRAEACDGVDNDCSGVGPSIDDDDDGVPDALDPENVPVGTVDPGETDLAAGGWLFECESGTGTQDAEPVSACEPLDVVSRPAESGEEGEDEDQGCGCASVSSPPFAALALLALAAGRRRR